VIDAFVAALDLAELGFGGVEPAGTGRPSYHPAALLRLYIYGYLNRVHSSRRLEREAGRNVEVMWLLAWLAPDHKTIADFRKDNGPGIKVRSGMQPTGAALQKHCTLYVCHKTLANLNGWHFRGRPRKCQRRRANIFRSGGVVFSGSCSGLKRRRSTSTNPASRRPGGGRLPDGQITAQSRMLVQSIAQK
jgi:hypothetical protein